MAGVLLCGGGVQRQRCRHRKPLVSLGRADEIPAVPRARHGHPNLSKSSLHLRLRLAAQLPMRRCPPAWRLWQRCSSSREEGF